MLMQLLKLLWVRWKAVAHRFATFQSRALLFVFYYVVLAIAAAGLSAQQPDVLARDALRSAPREHEPDDTHAQEIYVLGQPSPSGLVQPAIATATSFGSMRRKPNGSDCLLLNPGTVVNAQSYDISRKT